MFGTTDRCLLVHIDEWLKTSAVASNAINSHVCIIDLPMSYTLPLLIKHTNASKILYTQGQRSSKTRLGLFPTGNKRDRKSVV